MRLISVGLFFLLPLVFASPGDDLFIFDDCKFQCEQITCKNNHYYVNKILDFHVDNTHVEFGGEPYYPQWRFTNMPLPWYLQLLQWDCELNCDYQCQHHITKFVLDEGKEVLQFHGKWPFRRVLGAQEFASVVFSIGNFIPHYSGFRKVLKARHNTNSSAFNNVLLLALVTMAAWIALTIFHYRDTIITERTDYFLAGGTVLCGFYTITHRVFKLYLPEARNKSRLLSAACLLVYVGHVTKLILDWLYTYNMQANIFVAILQNLVWCMLCFQLYLKYYQLEHSEPLEHNKNHLPFINFKRIILPSFYARSAKTYSLYPLFLGAIVIIGMSLEIFDFAPIFYFVDAHALWHLVTIIPATYGLYDWLIWDISVNVIPELEEAELKKLE